MQVVSSTRKIFDSVTKKIFGGIKFELFDAMMKIFVSGEYLTAPAGLTEMVSVMETLILEERYLVSSHPVTTTTTQH